MYVCVYHRGWIWMLAFFYFFFNWKGYFVSWDQNCPWNVELENWARLASQWAREILLSRSPQITSTCLHFLLFTWLLRSSHLRAKHFTLWIVSLVLKLIPLRDLKGGEDTGILFPSSWSLLCRMRRWLGIFSGCLRDGRWSLGTNYLVD